ncbi:MAG: outer membrane lipoprotein-sorting protein [Bacteroidales bacterium]|nr:outer membrane lipoprotein-sorting protein [Bacteroidales bacterium]MDD4362458.1 outer membrane lipoprotein-sorting protein [Bacteroidales bacterium]
MRSLFFISILLLAQLLSAQDAREIIRKAGDVIEPESMEMVSTLKIISASGQERSRTISTATRKFGEVTKTMIRFVEPADVRGTTLLIFDYEEQDDDMWIYMPALRKTRRIVSSEKGKNFMGSEFTNADMSKPGLDEFDYQLLGEAEVEGQTCHKIESRCKTEAIAAQYGFSKRISYIDKADFFARKLEYYDANGELHRVNILKDYREQGKGKYFAYHMEMQNVKNNRRSVMTVDKFQMGSSLPEAQFSPAMLEQ